MFNFRHGEANKENRPISLAKDSKKAKSNSSALNLSIKSGNSTQNTQNISLARPATETRTQFYQLMPAAPDATVQNRSQHDYAQSRPADYSVQRLSGSTEPFKLSFAHSSASTGPTIQLARPTPPRERPHTSSQWIPMPSTSTSRPTITLQSPNQTQTYRSRVTTEQSLIPRPVILPPQADPVTQRAAQADRRASLPSVSTPFVNPGTSRQNSSLSNSSACSTWKSRQPTECDYCNRMFSNKFNLKQVCQYFILVTLFYH